MQKIITLLWQRIIIKITGKTPEQPPLPPQSLQAPPNSDSS